MSPNALKYNEVSSPIKKDPENEEQMDEPSLDELWTPEEHAKRDYSDDLRRLYHTKLLSVKRQLNFD